MPKVTATPAQTTTPTPGAIVGSVPATFAVPPGVPPPMMAESSANTMVSAGMADKFNGRCESMWLLPRMVEKTLRGRGKIKLHELFVQVNIRADDVSLGHEGVVTEYLKMDQLSQWVPSRTDPQWNGERWIYTPTGDGNLDTFIALHNGQTGFDSGEIDTATGEKKWLMVPPEAWWGWYPVPGKNNNRADFMKGTKWDHFKTQLETLGYRTKAPHINWADFRQLLVGVYAHWVRLPFEFKGQRPADSQQTELSTLCVADILDLGPISGAGGPTATATATASPVSVAVPATMPAAAPVPAPAATVAPVVGVPTAVAPTAAVLPSGLPARNDPAAISKATNDILTQLAAQKGAAGLSKAEAGTAVYAGVNAAGLDGGMALRFLNDSDNDKGWMVDDERTFWYVPAKGMIAASAEIAQALAAQ